MLIIDLLQVLLVCHVQIVLILRGSNLKCRVRLLQHLQISDHIHLPSGGSAIAVHQAEIKPHTVDVLWDTPELIGVLERTTEVVLDVEAFLAVRQDYEVNLLPVGMTLKHLGGSQKSAPHGRDINSPKVDLSQVLAAILTLLQSQVGDSRIKQIRSYLEEAPLFALIAKLLYAFLVLNVERSRGVSYE